MTSKATWSPVSMTEFAKSVKLKLDYSNWGAWKVQVVRALKVAGCAQYIGEDGGRAMELEDLLYERPEAPTVAELGIAGTVMTITTCQYSKCAYCRRIARKAHSDEQHLSLD